ncbi:hypothetical protein EDD18DRAFT_266414 [Armillaria luteobubalina]|uniref:Uncharacterized protein n=1 Tax=Armillaria luteobubalina TaxID=153913 RepID=A0AA39Q2U4_9AGAR|nr:hypothetical protein EDD18DRAFT_266414 [Armillaria luteobubalina]
MATGTHPATAIPELTDSQIEAILADLDETLNNAIFSALLYGIYTGVVAVTLWAVASRNCGENRRRPHFLVAIILLLYLLAGFNVYHGWAGCLIAYTTLAWKSVWEEFALLNSPVPLTLTGEVGAILSTVLADAALIWRCWIVWGRSWRVVLIPIACTTLATASRGIVAYYDTLESLASESPRALLLEEAVNWAVLYSSLVMATLLWCTILIIYRILRVGGAAGRIHVYQRVIEMLVESALLYSAVIVVLLVFEARNEVATLYVEDLAIAMRGIMPTILVGRVAAGHARPDDSWSESAPRSSIRFGNHSTSQNHTQISVESGRDTSSIERLDLEAGLEDITEGRVEGASSLDRDSTHDYHHVGGTTSSVDYSAV